MDAFWDEVIFQGLRGGGQWGGFFKGGGGGRS